jgi:hypothetical protein
VKLGRAVILLVLLLPPTLSATLRLDYYYDQSGMFTKFSDWIPKRLHQWQPQFVEDFFLLYSLKQLSQQEEIRRNIFFLKIALQKKFRHPREALCLIQNPQEYHKYRLMLHMHLNLQIMRSYLRLASLFDKRHLYFYNLDFAPELKNSFQVAEGYYRESMPYWKKARDLALEASSYNFEIDMPGLESIRADILAGDIDYTVFTGNHLLRLKQKQQEVDAWLAQKPATQPQNP